MVQGRVPQQVRQQALKAAARIISILCHLRLDEQCQPLRQACAGQLVAQSAFVGFAAQKFRLPVQSPQKEICLPFLMSLAQDNLPFVEIFLFKIRE